MGPGGGRLQVPLALFTVNHSMLSVKGAPAACNLTQKPPEGAIKGGKVEGEAEWVERGWIRTAMGWRLAGPALC